MLILLILLYREPNITSTEHVTINAGASGGNIDPTSESPGGIRLYNGTHMNWRKVRNDVELYYAGALKLETRNTGIYLDGDLITTGDIVKGTGTISVPNNTAGTMALGVSDTTTTTQGDLNLDFPSAPGTVSATGDAHGLASHRLPYIPCTYYDRYTYTRRHRWSECSNPIHN